MRQHAWSRKASPARRRSTRRSATASASATPCSAFSHYGEPVKLYGRSHHRQVKMTRGVTAGKFVRAGREQEVARDGANLGAVGIALVVHRQRLITRARVHAEADMRHGVGLAITP